MIGSQLVMAINKVEVLEEVSQGVDSEVVSEQVGVAIIGQRVVVPQVGNIYQNKTPLSLKGNPFVLSARKNTLHIHVSN